MEGLQLPIGTLVNALAVLVGGGAGLLLRRGLSERFRKIMLTAVGLATLAIGAQMALQFDNALVLIGSLFLGGLLGEALRIEDRLHRLAERFAGSAAVPGGAFSEADSVGAEARTPAFPAAVPSSSFAQGLVTAFLIFCVGPMTILGALNEGLRGDPTLLYAKSFLDLITGFVLAASFGVGVVLSAIPLMIYQLAITLLGGWAQGVFTDELTVQFTAVGGVLILGLGLNLLEIAKLKVANLLPALLIVIALELLLG